MKHFNLVLVVLTTLLAFRPVSGQILPETNINVKQEIEKWDRYFSSRTDAENQKPGSGFKPFNRWKWFMEQRMSENGTIPAHARWNAFQEVLERRKDNRGSFLTANWTNIGPNNMAGRMLDIAFDPNNPDVIWGWRCLRWHLEEH